MARINVNTLTSVLARMPDGDLQKYAEMHKSDPYVMALAMSESNRRKEMRSAGQGTQEEQPKVVDQMIAGMAPRQPMPEDMGIGAIPAPNMTMANGGIVGYDEGGMVAFADGGDVERYQDKGLIYETPYDRKNRLIREEAARRAAQGDAPLDAQAAADRASLSGMFQSLRGSAETAGRAIADVGALFPRGVVGAYDSAVVRPMRAAGINASYLSPMLVPKGVDPSSMTPFSDVATMSGSATQDRAARDRDTLSEQQAADAVAKAAPPPTGDTSRKALGAGLGAAAAPARFDSIEDLQKKYFGGLDADKAEVTKRREEVASGLSALAQSNLSEEEARIAGDKDLFKNKDARLARQEKELAGLDQRNMGLAIFKMGATMMGTRGGIAAAIGAGAGVGAEAYASGIAKIDLAKEKFAEAQDRLDNLKINRNDMNAKELRAATRGVKEAELQGLKLFQDGSEKDLGLKRQELGAVFTAAAGAVDSDKKIAAQQQIAAMQASTKETDPRMQVFKALVAKYNGDVLKANAELQTMGEESLKSFYKKEQLKELAKLKTSTAAAFTPQMQEQITKLERDVFGGSSVKTASMADIEASAKARGKTVQETLAAAKAQGFVIQ